MISEFSVAKCSSLVLVFQNVCGDDRVIKDIELSSDEITNALETMIRHFKKGAGMTDEVRSALHSSDDCVLYYCKDGF